MASSEITSVSSIGAGIGRQSVETKHIARVQSTFIDELDQIQQNRQDATIGGLTVDYTLNIDAETSDQPLALTLSAAFAENSLENVLGYLSLRADPLSANTVRIMRRAANNRSAR
ncbi:hypothetical protein EHI47_12000 [Rhizobium leguminosarum]|uniref:Uncharacterized protein n=1 Tax=Rhizobium leguminosarum TaxID=384 RepID=A0A444I2R5_RHILE|nr:hypothetical protein [Rhizobium leguminosarum]RWX31782.1 hypothetical protein EHI47_12000 [Rhizobium leguminosarum]